MSRERLVAIALLGFFIALGISLRLEQYLHQILLDDEWHAIHQLLSGKGPLQLIGTFGHADYSIPLGLLYWFEANVFGLSEWGMRWPMLFAGLATLVLIPLYVWRRFGPLESVITALLLALSPMLVIYTHQARPYALTLVLAWIALYAIDRYEQNHKRLWATLYLICAVLATWLHPLMGPLVVIPLAMILFRVMRKQSSLKGVQAIMLTIWAAVGFVVTLLPPLLGDWQGLALKSGQATIGLETISGAMFWWWGTPSALVVTGLSLLALAGMQPLLRDHRLAQNAVIGLGLTVLAILVLQPASVNHAGTFGRYLLPLIPLLMVSAALGAGRLLKHKALPKTLTSVLLLALAGGYFWYAPVWRLSVLPNNNINHSRFAADFRDVKNAVIRYQDKALSLSPFWQELSAAPVASLNVAVAPYYFESYHWDGPRWEKTGRQRTVPAFLDGFCAQERPGEVPDSVQFRLRNAVHLSALDADGLSDIDWLVFNRPIPAFAGTLEGRKMRVEAELCLNMLDARLGSPDYSDDILLAWRLSVE